MQIIQIRSAEPLQRQISTLDDGSQIRLQIYYRPTQAGWFIQELTYAQFILRSMRITVSPNILHQFRNKLPFGIACLTVANREPTQQQDFISGAANLYLLTVAEVAAYTGYLTNGTT